MGPYRDGGLSADRALLASALTGRRDELAEATAGRIMAEVAAGRAPLVRHRLLDQCRAHIDAVLQVPRVPGPERAGMVQAVAAAHGRAGAPGGSRWRGCWAATGGGSGGCGGRASRSISGGAPRIVTG